MCPPEQGSLGGAATVGGLSHPGPTSILGSMSPHGSMNSRSQKNPRQIINPSTVSLLSSILQIRKKDGPHSHFVYILCICFWLILLQLSPILSAIIFWGYKLGFFSRATSVTLKMRLEGHWVVCQHQKWVMQQWKQPSRPCSPSGREPSSVRQPEYPQLRPHLSSRNINNRNPLKLKHFSGWKGGGKPHSNRITD